MAGNSGETIDSEIDDARDEDRGSRSVEFQRQQDRACNDSQCSGDSLPSQHPDIHGLP